MACELAALEIQLSPIFRHPELKETASAFLDGLLANVERKS